MKTAKVSPMDIFPYMVSHNSSNLYKTFTEDGEFYITAAKQLQNGFLVLPEGKWPMDTLCYCFAKWKYCETPY